MLKVIEEINKTKFENEVSIFLRRLNKLKLGGRISEPKYFVVSNGEGITFVCIIEYAGDLLEGELV